MKRYRITVLDLVPAHRWLKNKADDIYFPDKNTSDNFTAKDKLRALPESDPDALNSWCETYLSKGQWAYSQNHNKSQQA